MSKRSAGAGGGTPATLALGRAGVPYVAHAFDVDAADADLGYGLAAAAALGAEPARVFKTLLAEVDGRPAVGIVPVTGQLSLKLLAAALGGKRAVMASPALAERLTGYVVGGISPFGQRRALPTVIDASCEQHATVFVSGGKRGLDLEVSPADLVRVLGAQVASIAASA